MRLFEVFLPAPDGAVFGVNYPADVAETALGEDARRSVRYRQRVSAHGANALGESEVGKRLGCLSRVAAALVLRVDGISNLHNAVCRWRPFEPAPADGAARVAVRDGEPVQPRIDGRRSMHRGKPNGRNLRAMLRTHRIDRREGFFSGRRDES